MILQQIPSIKKLPGSCSMYGSLAVSVTVCMVAFYSV
jgi:hypothetical protein